MIMCIYIITNNINGMIYVGQTTNMKRRYKEYKYGSKNLNAHKQFKFLQEMNSVGFDNFTFDILEIVNTKDDLNIREIYWIDTLKARDPAIGYNSKTGVVGGALLQESKDKMSMSSGGSGTLSKNASVDQFR